MRDPCTTSLTWATIAIKSALWSRIQNIGQSSRIDPYGCIKRLSKLSPVIININYWATLKKKVHRWAGRHTDRAK